MNLDLLVSALVLGSIYALITVGYVVVFRASGIFNFLHPDLMLIGALTYTTFAGTDNGTVARFECRLDGAAFTSCISPVTYAAVSRGTHTFRVRAVDNNGFTDPSPAVFNWTR